MAASAPIRLGLRTWPARDDDLADRQIVGAPADVLPGCTAAMMRTTRPSRVVSSTITTASAPGGIGAPVAISMHSPVVIPRAGTWPVNTRSTHAASLVPTARRRRIRRDDRVAVHRRAIERRHVDRCGDIVRDDATHGPANRHAFDAIDRHDGVHHQPKRVGKGDGVGKGPHFVSSRLMCPSSGRISFSMPSRTAASEPGSMKITQPATTPAVARESIAAAPISA